MLPRRKINIFKSFFFSLANELFSVLRLPHTVTHKTDRCVGCDMSPVVVLPTRTKNGFSSGKRNTSFDTKVP